MTKKQRREWYEAVARRQAAEASKPVRTKGELVCFGLWCVGVLALVWWALFHALGLLMAFVGYGILCWWENNN